MLTVSNRKWKKIRTAKRREDEVYVLLSKGAILIVFGIQRDRFVNWKSSNLNESISDFFEKHSYRISSQATFEFP